MLQEEAVASVDHPEVATVEAADVDSVVAEVVTVEVVEVEEVLEVAEEALAQVPRCSCSLTKDSREFTSCVERTTPS